MVRSRWLRSGLVLTALLLVTGCTSDETKQAQAVLAADEIPTDAFAVTTTLCRKVGRKSGRRIGAGHDFKVAMKSYVRALVDFQNVKPDRVYTVHLVWIRPDGREMFRKYAEVRQAATGSAEYQTQIDWLNAEDLHKIKSDTTKTEVPNFTLASRFNISTGRERELGQYQFRVYLDRRLLSTETFTVSGSAS